MQIRSLWKRITAKPVRELAGRTAAVCRDRFERLQYASGRLAPDDRLERSLGTREVNPAELLAARRAQRPAFFPSLTQGDRIRTVMAERYRDELTLTRTWADRALRHEFHFFGRVHHFPAEIPWQADPVSGRAWPPGFFGDVHRASEDAGCGDVKDVWELSRHQFLIDLGKSFFLEGTAAHSAETRRLVRSWIVGNPFATGINWASPLEPAYRTFSWLWTYYLTLDDPEFSAGDHVAWLRGFLDNGRFLHRHLELSASPFNHLIGEATALYLLGTLFPELREAGSWRRRGRAVLESRLPQQFYADGGTVEQATLYHHATLGFYLLAALVGRANRDEFSRDVWAAIERAIEFSMLLVQPDGQLPAIGDTDDARPIQLERKPFFDFRAYQAVGAVLFGRGDFKAIAGRFHEDALWLLGVDGLERFEQLAAAVPERRSVALVDSGYFVCRSDWTAEGDYVCFDCGEQAGGLRTDEVPSAAHGHADCLSVIVFLRGRPVLVDSGFYTYNGDERWERSFRQTAAHNTARVDCRNQATYLAKMAWTEVPRHRLEHVEAFEDHGCVVGSHDGFLKSTGVRHRRYVWYRRDGGYVVLFDDFEGEGEHDLEVNFHLAPLEATFDGNGLVVGDTVGMHWAASFPLTSTIAIGGNPPEEGWIAPSLGVRVAAPVVRLAGHMKRSGAGLLTVLAPREYRVSNITSADEAIALSIDGPCWSDVITAVPSRVDAAGSAPAAGLTITRQRAGAVVERLHVEGLCDTEFHR